MRLLSVVLTTARSEYVDSEAFTDYWVTLKIDTVKGELFVITELAAYPPVNKQLTSRALVTLFHLSAVLD